MRFWCQIGSKTCYISKVLKVYAEKVLLPWQARKCHLRHVNIYFTDQNLKQRLDPMEWNFEGREMQK